MTPTPASAAGRAVPWLLLAGVLVAALSLRGPIIAPTPVLRDIGEDLAIGSATVALLTTAPVLMFAVLTPLAALVIRRSGPELALLVSLSGVLVGTVVRALPGFGWMLTGTIVIGAAITIGNVVVPVVIRRDVPPDRVSIVTGAYVATLNAGSLLTSLLTAPLAAVVGWPTALLLWSVLSVAGIVLWGLHLARERRAGIDADERFSGELSPGRGAPGEQSPGKASPEDLDPRTLTGPMPVVSARAASFLRRPVPWLLLATFGAQTFMFYGLTTWLPVLTGDVLGLDRTAAGALASVFQGVAIAGAFLVPLLTRIAPAWVTVVAISGCWLALMIGTLTAPSLLVVWLSLGAIAHAGGFVVVFSLLVQVARSDAEAAGMSALVQGGGYAIGAVAGPLLGGLHEATGAWSAPLGLLVGIAAVYAVLLGAAFLAMRFSRR
ncbi:MFS transporter [Microbacterium sp. RD1]|uniref:MFS transporter n=1 Tax=Microbacterium sp. RD1 TaxID=3457313 RepID=UPI003FA55420